MDDIVFIDAVRTPIGRAKKGIFKDSTPDFLLTCVCQALISRSNFDPTDIGEICVGNVLQQGAGATSSRIAQLNSGFPHSVPLSAVNRQCASGLQAVANIASGIKSGFYDFGIAAGVETMSLADMNTAIPLVDPHLLSCSQVAKDCLIPMGITSDNVAQIFSISRDEQDWFALKSHRKAYEAQKAGRFLDEIVPVKITVHNDTGHNQVTVTDDEGIRPNTTIEDLKKLKAVFQNGGTTTAGNSSQISDGASGVLMASRKRAIEKGYPIIAIFKSFAVIGVPPSIMGIGPVFAIPLALQQARLSINDVDIFEINEAFASQAVYCIKKLGLNPDKVNPNGGAIALGHPLGCTGVRQLTTLLYELIRRKKDYGVVSMCAGTGMGAAAVVQLDISSKRSAL